jgi:hypothetical protein
MLDAALPTLHWLFDVVYVVGYIALMLVTEWIILCFMVLPVLWIIAALAPDSVKRIPRTRNVATMRKNR